MIGLDPDVVWRSTGAGAQINRRALVDPDAFVRCPGKPLDALRALLAESHIDMPSGLPPMSAGVFGYLGYDMVRHMERLAPAKPDPIGVPDALLVRPTVIIVFDATRDEMAVVTPVRPAPGVVARVAYEGAQARLDAVVAALEAPLDHKPPEVDPTLVAAPATSNTTEAEYLAMVAKAKDYIAAGDARSCCRSGSPVASSCPPSRSIARCGASIRRPTFVSSISAASRSSSRARRFSSGCGVARSASGRSPARAGAA
jgi:anthranilate synthase component 1